ncbi:hypothetical protein [Paraburkholderia sp. BL21I4N1]|uniref:hypothetical protein n=1 Tax=Paraburkholderia sp. BL21I4N1 TaxID=1938801 RepID=UPI000D4950FE|nr:hypothetical protein [Paraburkholderia sp. BL21I4N1]PQV47972.1 hypothetical protein B0G83_10958 [Paraburkholderia sp. BL21I4N1]
MATNITITKRLRADSAVHHDGGIATTHRPAARKLPGWLWFVALWCFGVGSAMLLGFAFKLLMNATLFAVK